MKQLLFLIPSLCNRGAERVLVNLVNHLDSQRYQVTVQTLFDVGSNRSRLSPRVIYKRGLPFIFRGNVTLMKLLSPQALYRLLIHKRYDIVVAFLEGPATRIISGCPYADSRKVAWVHVEQHTRHVASHSFRSYQEACSCYSAFDEIVSVANTVKKDFEQLFPFSSRVFYNVHDDKEIIRLSKESNNDIEFSNELNIISVGSLETQKGFDLLLDVHHRLLQDGILNHIYIVGSGSEHSTLQKKSQAMGITTTVHFLGEKNNPYQYMAHADLFVCSSRFEGISTAVTEAIILGLPIVSTRCSGAEELLGRDNEYGIVTDIDAQSLYEGVKRMVSTNGLLGHYAEQSRMRSAIFSKNNTIAELNSFFSEKLEVNESDGLS